MDEHKSDKRQMENSSCQLSIITVNYNGLDDTCTLIDTIIFNDQMEMIVVDNGSTVDEAAIISQRYPHVKVIRSDSNLGFAGGNNLGIKAASGRYLFLINNDTLFKSFDVRPLVKRMESSSNIAVVCPKIRFAWDPQPLQFTGYTPLSRVTLRNQSIGFSEHDNGQYDAPHTTPYAHGAAMMIRREAIERVGLMPECYFLYYEELDWSLMFTRAGYEIWYEPGVTIYHKESSSTGIDSPLKTYYVTRNRLLFASRNIRGFYRFATYGYLSLLVLPRDICKYLLRRRPDLAKAALRGVGDFCIKRTTNNSSTTNNRRI